jgi:hypothetical protein
MTPSLKEKIQQEAEVKALMERDRLPPDLPFTRKDDYRAGYAEGYEAGAEAILSNPGEYGLAGRWRTPEEKMPPQNKRVLVEFKSGDCQMYELSVDANAIRAWWIRNVKRWLDESEPARRYATTVEAKEREIADLKDTADGIEKDLRALKQENERLNTLIAHCKLPIH